MNLHTVNLISIGLLLGGASAQATTLNLITNQDGTINGGFFTRSLSQSTGTGVINPFVRLQDNGVADGFNADSRPVMGDVNTSGQFTRDLLLSEVPIMAIGGVDYYEFLLDINQTAANPFLSLDILNIYTRATAIDTSALDTPNGSPAAIAAANAAILAALTSTSTLRYSLDGLEDSKVLLDYGLNNGSGSGDMFAYIPKSLFGPETNYVYLYSSFGNTGGDYEENDGFEEWAVKSRGTTTVVPDGGATIALFGLALLGMGGVRKMLGSRKA